MPDLNSHPDQPTESPVALTRRAIILRAGSSDAEIRRRQRAGDLAAVRPGTYADPAQLVALDRVEQHRVLIAATAARTDLPLSHISAAVAWDLPIWGADLSRVHYTRNGGTGGRRGSDRHAHSAMLPVEDVTICAGRAITTVARTLVDVARTESADTLVVAADFALHSGVITQATLKQVVDRVAMSPGAARARRALRLVDGRSESPGESRTRYELRDCLPLEAQVEIRDEDGRFIARVDLGCQEAMLLIEFDGVAKYLALRRPGQSIEAAVLAEKRREDALRALGYEVVRVTWQDLADPQRLAARIEAAYRRGLARRAAGHRPRGTYLTR